MGCGASQAEQTVSTKAITKKPFSPEPIKPQQEQQRLPSASPIPQQKPPQPVQDFKSIPIRKVDTPRSDAIIQSARSVESASLSTPRVPTIKSQQPQLVKQQSVEVKPPVIENYKTSRSSPVVARAILNTKAVLKPIPTIGGKAFPSNTYNLNEEVGDVDDDDEYVDDEPVNNRMKNINFENNGSALSDTKSSNGSQDSGFSDNEFKNIITEKSNPDLVQQIEKEFKERELDLCVTGRACPILLSAKEKQEIERYEEEMSLEMLKENGLVQQPIVRKDLSVKFEIIEEKVTDREHPMARPDPFSKLAPLKRVPPQFLTKKEKSIHSQDQIVRKLEEADRRREQQTQQKINQLKSHFDKNDNYDEVDDDDDEDFRPQSAKKFDPEVYERQKKLLEIRDKIRQKNNEAMTPRSITPRAVTPRTQELLIELDKFRPKTSNNFKPVFD